jgi:rhamnogalacturonyl hydrolase YesR
MNDQLPDQYKHLLKRPRLNATDGQPTHGLFDDVQLSSRVRYIQGVLVNTISRMWVETDNPEHFNRLDDWMKLPWGSYPDVPPKKK